MKAVDARVVLTGATGGIGAAAVRAFLEAGASLMLVGRSPQRLAAAARQGNPAGRLPATRLTWQQADLHDPAAVAALREAADTWGANVLVQAAGVPSFGRFVSTPFDDIEAMLQANLIAPMRLTQALLPMLLARRHAQIVHVGSALGRLGLPGFAAYAASKFGLRGFSEALRRELAGTSVKVQYLGPRSTRTAFNDARVDAFHRATGTAVDTPEAVAAALLALVESEAAERWVGFPERLAVRLNGLAPTLLDGMLAAQARHLPDATPTDPPAAAAAALP